MAKIDLATRIRIATLFDSYQNLIAQSQRQVLCLFLIEDLTISEIAKELATTRQAVMDAIQKGVSRLEAIAKTVK